MDGSLGSLRAAVRIYLASSPTAMVPMAKVNGGGMYHQGALMAEITQREQCLVSFEGYAVSRQAGKWWAGGYCPGAEVEDLGIAVV